MSKDLCTKHRHNRLLDQGNLHESSLIKRNLVTACLLRIGFSAIFGDDVGRNVVVHFFRFRLLCPLTNLPPGTEEMTLAGTAKELVYGKELVDG